MFVRGRIKFFLLGVWLLIVLNASRYGESGRCQRPFGVVRLGALDNVSMGVTHLPEYGLLLERTTNGLRAMSTLNPVSAIPLSKVVVEDRVVLRDPEKGLIFGLDGNQVGVAKAGTELSLQHYRLIFDVNEAKNLELAVIVGDKRSSGWRLDIPG